ncbi:MAG: hypothetical protein WCK54_21670, partial [Desulfuromonadales bacterium]
TPECPIHVTSGTGVKNRTSQKRTRFNAKTPRRKDAKFKNDSFMVITRFEDFLCAFVLMLLTLCFFQSGRWNKTGDNLIVKELQRHEGRILH